MIRYILGRLLQTVPVLIGVSLVVFLLVRLLPGNPAIAVLGSRATPQLIKEATAQLHLNEPIWKQYIDFLTNALHGDFGVSYFYETSVWSLTIPRVPITLELIAYASVLALLITFPAALIAAFNRGRFFDQLVRVVFTTALGIPTFWLGLLLALYLGVEVNLFPTSGSGSGGLDTIYHLTLPALTIAIAMSPLLVRALRLQPARGHGFRLCDDRSGERPPRSFPSDELHAPQQHPAADHRLQHQSRLLHRRHGDCRTNLRNSRPRFAADQLDQHP